MHTWPMVMVRDSTQSVATPSTTLVPGPFQVAGFLISYNWIVLAYQKIDKAWRLAQFKITAVLMLNSVVLFDAFVKQIKKQPIATTDLFGYYSLRLPRNWYWYPRNAWRHTLQMFGICVWTKHLETVTCKHYMSLSGSESIHHSSLC